MKFGFLVELLGNCTAGDEWVMKRKSGQVGLVMVMVWILCRRWACIFNFHSSPWGRDVRITAGNSKHLLLVVVVVEL